MMENKSDLFIQRKEKNLSSALGGQLLLGKQFAENSKKLLVYQTSGSELLSDPESEKAVERQLLSHLVSGSQEAVQNTKIYINNSITVSNTELLEQLFVI